MSSDSETCPSPLPSPIFARCSPARGTVARRCREFYLKRLERTTSMQKRWSICDVPPEGLQDERPEAEVRTDEGAHDSVETLEPRDAVRTNACDKEFDGFPLRKCRSSFDVAMDSLRREISSLIAQDNDLFRQLLSLHDSIAELRERQRHSLLYLDDDDDDDRQSVRDDDRHSPSLDSLSDPGEIQETSPESTLSSRSSLSATSTDCKPRFGKPAARSRYRKAGKCGDASCGKPLRHRSSPGADSRPLVFIDKSEICFRCRKLAPPYRRSSSITSLYYLHEDMESYDSGIHLHGSHSDSDHEIFV